ncbi:DUF418 domain-containing protein [Glycomyces algeriensis]|uniref:DUF418 domain-containing protein n=1 Tax=Glycomyces algeriensis TaxID=256037 RepID=A0A9W6LG39_9ACTN|nr:DUF418 domain-containing protein [Glycomyces algeriensis]MDA1365067.1 DUF418 domain-containing protein [Glycomyces algeriensis]MDR7349871.1 putative membrane protein YeiB [Glycomyces algeriensis]GLI42582.1 hypothetical protein GALLR39Z86_24320 [Glycomyces algeriensis]
MTTAPSATADPPAPPLAPAPIAKAERSLAPDIARGFMLLFIALANVPVHLWGMSLDRYNHNTGQSASDHIAYFFEQLLIAERSRPMFAVLYGFGIAIMASRMLARGVKAKGVRKVLRRRSWWLLAFGTLHSVFLFWGDILAPYGAMGLIALFFVHLSDKSLKTWLWGSIAYVVLIGNAVMAFFFTSAGSPPSFDLPPYLNQMLVGAIASPTGVLGIMLTGSFFPLVVAGMMLHRAGWIERPEAHLPQLKRVFITGMAVNVLSALPVALIALGAWEPSKALWVASVYLTLLGGLYAGLGYICGFALLAHMLRGFGRRGVPGALAAVGERSLTSYLLQSLIMAPLLTAWGFGLGEDLGYLGAFGVAFGTWLVTVAVAVALDKAGKRGPFEVLLRRLTYGPKRS